MEGKRVFDHDATPNMPYVFQRSVLHESSTIMKPEGYNRALLSAFQFTQQQGPTHPSTNPPQMAPVRLASSDDVSRRMNPFPVELLQNRYGQPNTDIPAQQPVGQGSLIPFMADQQVASTHVSSASSSNDNLDALSRQIMLAGMAALGMNTTTLQNQAVLGENTASHSVPMVSPYNFPVSSMQESSVKSSVPDGSGLLKYRAPEIESFIYDRNTGYRLDPTTGLHYDANTGFYINVALKIFMRWDPLSSTYLRENKRSAGQPHSVGAVLNSQSTVPTIQPTLGSVYSADITQRFNADSANALLGSHLLSTQVEKPGQDGYARMQIPADISVGFHGRPFMNELGQPNISFDIEGGNSKINQDPGSTSEMSDPKNKNKGANKGEHDLPRRYRKRRSSSSSSSNSQVSHGLREGKRHAGRSRSRSSSRRKGPKVGSTKRRSVSRGRKRSRSHSSEGGKKRRSRSNHKEGARRSRSREHRRSHSRSPRRRVRGNQRRNITRGGARRGRSLGKDPRTKSGVRNQLSHPGAPNRQKTKGQSSNSSYATPNSAHDPNSLGVESGSSSSRLNPQVTLKSSDHETFKNAASNSARGKEPQEVVGSFNKVNTNFVPHYFFKNPEKRVQEIGSQGFQAGDSIASSSSSKPLDEPDARPKETTASGPPIKCFRCDSTEHTVRDCKEGGRFCFECQKMCDHIGANCPFRLAKQKQNTRVGQKKKTGIWSRLSPRTGTDQSGKGLSKTTQGTSKSSQGPPKKSQGSSFRKDAKENPKRCFKCMAVGHNKEQCTVDGTHCYGCNQITDHVRANCPFAPPLQKKGRIRYNKGFNRLQRRAQQREDANTTDTISTCPNKEEVQPDDHKTQLVAYSSDSGESDHGSKPTDKPSTSYAFKRNRD